MCRFIAYKGPPVLLDTLLYQPKNSLIHQSYHALERRDPVNGDGFGIAWYVPDLSPEPSLFLSVRPAWNNRNLRSLAPRILSGCIFAHVRAAGIGGVTESNCHPFQFGRLLMMHNGDIGGFYHIKRQLSSRLSDKVYTWIRGETDSEHFFALFLTHLFRNKAFPGPDEHSHCYNHMDIVNALKEAIVELKEILHQEKVEEDFYLNVAVTDGDCMVATRYDTNKDIESPTLYHSEGSRYVCEGGRCHMIDAEPSEHAVLIVSEKLTAAIEDWNKVPEEHFVVINEDLDINILPVSI